MRRKLALLGLPVAWAACFSSTNNEPPDASPDGPSLDATEMDAPGPDAVLPEAEAAVAVDAPAEAREDAPPEAMAEASLAVDAPPDTPVEAAPSPVVVTVYGALGPESGVSVVWGDASGNALTTTITDATGSTSMLASGGMVTALLGTPSSSVLYTITGVEPGDALVVVDWTSLGLLPGGGSETVNLTSYPPSPPTAATQLLFYAGGYCETGSNLPITLPLTVQLLSSGYNGLEPSCIGIAPLGSSYGAAYPALVDAQDANDNLIGFAYANNNLFTTLDDAGALDVAIGGTWSTAMTSQTVSVTNVASVSPWVYYSEAANGVLVSLPRRTLPGDASVPDGGSEYAYTTHQGFADFVQTEIGTLKSGNDFVMMATRAPAPTASGNTTMDASQLAAIPQVTGSSVDTTVAAQPDLSWTSGSTPLTSATALVAAMTWTGTDSEGGAQGGTWIVVSAGGAPTDIQAPALPAALGAWTPVAGSSFYGSLTVVQGGTVLPGYAQARAASSFLYPIVQTTCLGYFGPGIPALPANGTIGVSFNGGGCG